MKYSFAASAAMVAVLVAGCTRDISDGLVVEGASRNVTIDSASPALEFPVYQARSLTVLVPETLEVSESNAIFPNADIVWRGDAPGDRHAQVRALVEAGMRAGIAETPAGRGTPVHAQVQITRFHSVTERTRYTYGGVHAIEFYLSFVDTKTKALIERRHVTADLKALGGSRALAAEAKGITMKTRIADHLAEVIKQELAHQGEL